MAIMPSLARGSNSITTISAFIGLLRAGGIVIIQNEWVNLTHALHKLCSPDCSSARPLLVCAINFDTICGHFCLSSKPAFSACVKSSGTGTDCSGSCTLLLQPDRWAQGVKAIDAMLNFNTLTWIDGSKQSILAGRRAATTLLSKFEAYHTSSADLHDVPARRTVPRRAAQELVSSAQSIPTNRYANCGAFSSLFFFRSACPS